MSNQTSPSRNVFYFSNEFPPDELHDVFRRLRSRSKTQRHPVLRSFLSQATLVLREEISQLPGDLRSQLPPLGNALDLAEVRNLHRGPLAGALEGVLLCLLHIASVIGYHEQVPGQFQFSKSTTCFTGIGIGLLGAAAVSSSPTLTDLPKLGSEALRIAWRMGVLVNDISQGIECQELGTEPESWAAVVMNLDENTVRKELDDFNKSTCSPIPSQLFVSAGGTDNVTISGPPSKCRKIFRASNTLRSARYARLPVYGGLCHAPHIYNSTHADSIMSASTATVVDEILVDAGSVLSTGDGAPFQGNKARDLFKQVVLELLTGTIRWNLAMDGAIDFLSTLPEECNVYALRPCGVAMAMVSVAKTKVSGCQFNDLLQWVFEDNGTETPLRREDSKIAIIGMSCRFPDGANDLDSFWQLLEEGRDVHKKVPADRYDVRTHTDPTGKSQNTSLTPFGCFIDQPGLFDAGFFDMSPREAAQTDPMHRLALVTAYEALEQSGFVANRTQSTDRRRVSTFYGQSCDDYREANAGQVVDTYFIPGGCRAFAPGRINYFFKFSGPSFDCDTACSASLATIQIACTSLLHGDTDMVVAGGLNILTNSDGFAGLSQGHFLSKTGGCKTFDCNADGYCRADGIGSIILKRLDDAQRDNDNILGVIGASATNHSADAISITHPHAPTQEYLYRHIMREAGVRPQDVDFVEMHGTGTQAGDATEIESVTAVFAPPKRTQPLYIGSVKSNVGHGEAAAGVTALIKLLLALQRSAIPKHVGIKTALNPRFPDLDRLNIRIPTDQVPWPRSTARKRYAIVNNFSAAGGNTTLLVEEAPLRPEPQADPRTAFTVAISAKSSVSLKANLQSLLTYLESNPSVDLAHLSYTTMARRMHHNHRLAVHGSSHQLIMREFQEYLPALDAQRPIPKTAPTIAFIFSGQGSFYTGIGRQLYDSHPGFQKQILRLNEICLSHGFPSFLGAITGTGSPDEPQSEPQPIVTHLTIVCVGLALSWLWGSIGIKPSVIVGASIGEFAALHAAGVLSASDTIYLAGKRALLLESLCTANTHGMLAVRATLEQVRGALVTEIYEVACVNGARDITLAGSVEDIANTQLALEAHGYKCTQIVVPYAFHSAHVDPILDQYEQIAGGVTFKPPSVPLLSPLLADCVFDDNTINASYMRQATRQPVYLFDSLNSASDTGLVDKKTGWIEIGPHGSYSNFVRSAMPDGTLTIASLKRDEDNWRTFARGMAQLYNVGLDLDWNAWNAPFEMQYLRLLDLPSYHWNAKNHWIQYNGDWMLVKDKNPSPSRLQVAPTPLHTSLIHHLVEESIGQDNGEVTVQSNVLHPSFLEAMYGHKMNECAVATSSIHADIAFTLAKYLYSRINPHSNISATSINIKNMQVEHGLIARKDRSLPQCIQIRAIADLSIGSVQISWHHVDDQGRRSEDSFVTAVAEYGNPENWLQEWCPMTHLVLSRINDLQRLADEGKATSLSRDMVYTLFANLVDYADRYRGMQRVVLNGMEAMANVTLDPEMSGSWTVAPHYIDSVVHLAGFILNGGNALDPRRNFYVTPGWKTMRFARPLAPGSQFMSYVHMLPVHGQPGFYAGDVYIFQDGEMVGLVGGITFRSFPRILLSEFFSPPDTKKKKAQHTVHANTTAPGDAAITPPSPVSTSMPGSDDEQAQITPTTKDSDSMIFASKSTTESSAVDSPLIQQAMELIAQETEVDLHDLSDGTELSSIGVDSLLSLVLAQRFNVVLNLNLHSSLFLDSPTIGDFKSRLLSHC